MTTKPTVFVPELLHPAITKDLAAFTQTESQVDYAGEAEYAIIRNFPINREVLEKLPRLKMVIKHGAGLDTINTELLDERGISWTSTPGKNSNGVAELAVHHALGLLRTADPREGGHPQRELRGRVASILGLGRVGTTVAHIVSRGFGASVRAFDPFADSAPDDVELVGNPLSLATGSDVFFVTCPLTEETRGVVDETLIRRLNPGAVIVNTSRAPIVENLAIQQALESAHLHGYAHDFAGEVGAYDLHANRGVVLGTSHLGGSTDEALQETGAEVVRILRKVLSL